MLIENPLKVLPCLLNPGGGIFGVLVVKVQGELDPQLVVRLNYTK